jgi:hypothetical protein
MRMITRTVDDRGWGIGVGPARRRLVLARHYGARWWFGGISISWGTGAGGYVGLVLGERIDNAPWSIGLGPLQIVAS